MLRVSLDKVKEGAKVAKTVYSADGKILLFKGQELKQNYINKLKKMGIFWAYIDDERTKDIIVHDLISEETKRDAMVVVKDVITKLKDENDKVDISAVKEVVDRMIEEILSHKHIMINLIDVRSYEDYLYAHSVSTTIFTIVCGFAHKYNAYKLRDLGIGALLHDVGKIKVPEKVLNKPGKLTEQEWEIMKKHTVWGFEMLRSQKELNLVSAHVAYQHHEKCDSSGYPRKLSNNEILPYAKLVSICDCYDALTADRAYRKGFLPNEAMEIIQEGIDSQFTNDLVTKFFENVAPYPVGVQVELNTGERGVVLKVNKGNTFKPKVRIFYDEKGEEVPIPYEVDLANDNTLSIKRICDYG